MQKIIAFDFKKRIFQIINKINIQKNDGQYLANDAEYGRKS